MTPVATGHGIACLKTTVSHQIHRQVQPATRQNRNQTTPPVSSSSRSPRSNGIGYRQKHARCHQIPIDRTGRATEAKLTAISFLEACPTPADRARRSRFATTGVRQPLTTAIS